MKDDKGHKDKDNKRDKDNRDNKDDHATPKPTPTPVPVVPVIIPHAVPVAVVPHVDHHTVPCHLNPKILFVLKKRSSYGISYGLINSCQFVAKALEKHGIVSEIAQVIDNNCIDRAIAKFKPTHVIIEALWVVPSKFPVLMSLHPHVKFLVRVHSQVPFLGYEGMAFEWIKEYRKLELEGKGPSLMVNSEKLAFALHQSINIPSILAPNIYEFQTTRNIARPSHDKEVNIGCFGAIRPFKNHLNQAMAALLFAKRKGLKLNFYINSSRFEHHGEAILKNLRHIFKGIKHRLLEQEWSTHPDFIKLARKMNLGLQVSYTETFNIVAADLVSTNIPVVGSPEIDWMHSWFQADPNDIEDIADKLDFAYDWSFLNLHRLNEFGLNKHNKLAIQAWLDFLY